MSASCHEEGIVTDILPGNRVKVLVKRTEACGSCEARGACHALGSQTKDLELVVENSLNAEEGHRVLLEMEETAVLKASAILYLVPALGLICGATIGYLIAGKTGANTDGTAIVGSMSGLGLGFAISTILGKRVSKQKSFVPRLASILYKSSRP